MNTLPTVRLVATLALVASLAACRDASVVAPAREVAMSASLALENPPTEGRHVTGHGDHAYAYWTVSGPEGMTYGWLEVSRGANRLRLESRADDTAGTYLYYSITRCDLSDYCQSQAGDGLIPDEDLTTNGRSTVHLRTNTAGNPDFDGDGPGGLITADWRRDNAITTDRDIRETVRTAAFTLRRVESSSMSSAHVTGQLLGTPIGPNAQGAAGTSRFVRLEIVRDSVPVRGPALGSR